MNLYDFLIKAIEKDEVEKLAVNMGEKSIRLKGKYILKNGVLQTDFVEINGKGYLIEQENLFPEWDNWEIEIEKLYNDYKYSRPASINKTSFYALKADQMTDEEIFKGKNRWAALLVLELAIVLGSVSGVMKWRNPEHWFWVSPNDTDLVLYRKWF